MPRKKKRVYRAAKGAQYNDVDAQLIGEHMATTELTTPDDIVADASKARSPLHSFFDWDDTTAAHKHRLLQARQLINHLHVVIVYKGEQIESRAFHSVEIEYDDDTTGREYAGIDVVDATPDYSQQVVRTALRQMQAWAQRYKQYSAIFGVVFEAITEAEEAISEGEAVKA